VYEVTLAMCGTGILPVQARSLHHEFPHLKWKCYIDLFQQGKYIKMSEKITTITVRKLADNEVVEVLADGSTMPLKGKTDWEKIKNMTDEEIALCHQSVQQSSYRFFYFQSPTD
jgi:hypothetical protein